MVGRGLRQVIAQEITDGNGIAATFGNAALAGNILKETQHEHFEIDRRINARAAAAAIRIGRGADLPGLFGKLERSQCLVQFGIEGRGRGLNQSGRRNKKFGLRQGFGLEHANIIAYPFNKARQFYII